MARIATRAAWFSRSLRNAACTLCKKFTTCCNAASKIKNRIRLLPLDVKLCGAVLPGPENIYHHQGRFVLV